MSFQLVMRSGPTPGAVYPLEGDQLTIGRDSTNGVAINDPEVSRRHARLTEKKAAGCFAVRPAWVTIGR